MGCGVMLLVCCNEVAVSLCTCSHSEIGSCAQGLSWPSSLLLLHAKVAKGLAAGSPGG